jgi:hypothetical protein
VRLCRGDEPGGQAQGECEPNHRDDCTGAGRK